MRLNDCLIKCFTKRMRYKVINDNYYHFVFQGYRVEMIIEKSYYIICICKGISPRKTNSIYNCNDNIIYISDNKGCEYIYNEVLYNSFIKKFDNFANSHNKWLKKDGGKK